MGTTSAAGQLLSAVMALLGFGVVIVLAYIFTRYIGNRFTAGNGKSENIKIIDKTAVAQDKSLMIIKTAGKTLLIGVTPQHIELISELDGDKISEVKSELMENKDFYSILKNTVSDMIPKKNKSKNEEKSDERHD